MQTPNEKTPIPKCNDLAAYAARMMSKFTDNVVLVELAAKMAAAGEALAQKQSAYEGAVQAILPARVDVKYENFASDQRIRRMQKKAELADGKSNGPIVTFILPEGSTPIVRLLGDAQVQAMTNLEGRLSAAKPIWSEAETELADIKTHRERYALALTERRAKAQAARDLRAARNAEKASFLLTYATIAHQVEAEFPRDKAMQDLFFDDVRGRSTAEQASGDEDVPDTDEGGATPPAATPS